MIKNYKKKPVIIQALEWSGSNYEEIDNFLGSNYEFSGTTLIIHTLEGDMSAKKGDYIIKGVRGEFYPCEKSIFEETYEEAE